MFERLSLQVKIIGIITATVMVVLGVSTLIATFLTRDPVEAELYNKALAQARLTALQLAAPDTLGRPDVLLQTLRQLLRETPGIIQADVYAHGRDSRLVATTSPNS